MFSFMFFFDLLKTILQAYVTYGYCNFSGSCTSCGRINFFFTKFLEWLNIFSLIKEWIWLQICHVYLEIIIIPFMEFHAICDFIFITCPYIYIKIVVLWFGFIREMFSIVNVKRVLASKSLNLSSIGALLSVPVNVISLTWCRLNTFPQTKWFDDF